MTVLFMILAILNHRTPQKQACPLNETRGERGERVLLKELSTRTANVQLREIGCSKTIIAMTKKEQFMAFILVGATARDISGDSNDCQLILHMAGQIPCDAIPVNVMNAAKVYLAFCSFEGKRPFRWMLPPAEENAAQS
jgi:hypothetical protein